MVCKSNLEVCSKARSRQTLTIALELPEGVICGKRVCEEMGIVAPPISPWYQGGVRRLITGEGA